MCAKLRQNRPNRRDDFERQTSIEERHIMATTTTVRETAKIYQFPAGGRAAVLAGGAAVKPIDAFAAAAATRVVAGGSWYHEEAIRETDPPVGKR